MLLPVTCDGQEDVSETTRLLLVVVLATRVITLWRVVPVSIPVRSVVLYAKLLAAQQYSQSELVVQREDRDDDILLVLVLAY